MFVQSGGNGPTPLTSPREIFELRKGSLYAPVAKEYHATYIHVSIFVSPNLFTVMMDPDEETG